MIASITLASLALSVEVLARPHEHSQANHLHRGRARSGSPAGHFSIVADDVGLAGLSYNPNIKDDAYVALTRRMPRILSNAIQVRDPCQPLAWAAGAAWCNLLTPQSSRKSWELGTLTQALLEVYNPALTPFAYDPAAWADLANLPTTLINITATALHKNTHYDWGGAPIQDSCEGGEHLADLSNFLSSRKSPVPLLPQPLVDGDGSLADPAALGTAGWVLARFANIATTNGSFPWKSGAEYAWAVGNQLAYLYSAPNARAKNGTISHREGHVELWADTGYMIPPFLAYVGLAADSTGLLSEALSQWHLESSALLDPEAGMYRHVNSFDPHFWATGNGWMLAGLMRVLAAICAAGPAATAALAAPVAEAEETAARVLTSLLRRLDTTARLPNYMDAGDLHNEGAGDPTLFAGDSTGTAAVLAAYYRFAVLRPNLAAPLARQARLAFRGVVAQLSAHDWLQGVVDPHGTNGFRVYPDANGVLSPEGQSTLALLWAARTAAGL